MTTVDLRSLPAAPPLAPPAPQRLFGSSEVLIPPSEFYWAILPQESDIRVRCNPLDRRSIAILDTDFSAHLPCPLEDLAVAYAPLSHATFIACGLPLATLDSAIRPDTLAVIPSQLPPWLVGEHSPASCAAQPDHCHGAPSPPTDASSFDLRSLNLLIGRREPAALRRARRARTLAFVAAILSLGTIGATGLLRRESAAHMRAAAAQSAIDRSLQSPAASGFQLSPRTSASLISLAARARSLPAVASGLASRDAGSTLESLLAHWPRSPGIRVTGLTVGSSEVHLEATFPSHDSSSEFAAALSRVPGFVPFDPQIHAHADRVDLRISIRRASATEVTPPLRAATSSAGAQGEIAP